MSPASRKRASKKPKPKAPRVRPQPNVEEVFDEIVAGFADATSSDDPMLAEIIGSDLLGMWWLVDHDAAAGIGPAVIDHARKLADPNAVALLLALRAVGTDDIAARAGSAAEALIAAGVAAPAWAGSIGHVTPGECWRWGDVYGDLNSVLCVFDGPSGKHGLTVLIDCAVPGGYAKDAFLVDNPDEALAQIPGVIAAAEDAELLRFDRIEPAQARRLIEDAMRRTDDFAGPELAESYAELRALAIARCRLLPASDEPAVVSDSRRHALVTEFLLAAGLDPAGPARRCADLLVEFGVEHDTGDPLRVSVMKADQFLHGWLADVPLSADEAEAMPDVVVAFTRWAAEKTDLSPHATEVAMQEVQECAAGFRVHGPDVAFTLPASRSDSYTIRVDLDGAKPPIWRRLRVPGDISLAELHDVLQVAFDWDGSHLHQFLAGRLIVADPTMIDYYDLDEQEVALSQVAPNPGMKLEYLYDFGDNWQHNIKVEKVEEPDDQVVCLTGRRAAPLEDSGGIWGYEAKLAVAADKEHPDHDLVMDWLGEVPDPELFDVDKINAALRQ